MGLFIDASGTDEYQINEMPAPAGIGDDSAWVQSRDADPAIAKNERGSGVDGRGESTLHAR